MATIIEVLIHRTGSERGKELLMAAASAMRVDGHVVRQGYNFTGCGKVLFLYGPGAPDRMRARELQTKMAKHTVMFDLGYFCRDQYMRMSITDEHPQRYMDITPNSPERFERLGVNIVNHYDPAGPIILVGMGRKTHAIPGRSGWEFMAAQNLRQRFPDRKIIYRPKPGAKQLILDLGLEISDPETPIQKVLRGASLVVCRHSNVAVDAVVAGIPFDAEDGAATWMNGRPYTIENRLDFLHRLAHWQWRQDEMHLATRFALDIISKIPKPKVPK